MKQIKIGDLVMTCSLMPAIVMKVDGDRLECRDLYRQNEEYNGKEWSDHSIIHCGISLITPEEAAKLLFLGKKRVEELYKSSDTYEEFQMKVNEYCK